MYKTLFQPTYRAGLIQSRAYRKLKNFMQESLSAYDLSMMEWAIIGFIYDAGPKGIRTSVLAENFDVEPSFMTNTINSLENRALVKRVTDLKDQRAKKVILPKTTQNLVKKIEAQLRARMKKWMGPVSKPKLAAYLSVLEQISELD